MPEDFILALDMSEKPLGAFLSDDKSNLAISPLRREKWLSLAYNTEEYCYIESNRN